MDGLIHAYRIEPIVFWRELFDSAEPHDGLRYGSWMVMGDRRRGIEMLSGEALAEAERDVRELEQYVADQIALIGELQAASVGDKEAKAQEGLFLLSDALETARRRLRLMRAARRPS